MNTATETNLTSNSTNMTNNSDSISTNDNRSFYKYAIKWGIATGLIMSLYLFAIDYATTSNIIALKFLKYLFLIGAIAIAIPHYINKVDQTIKFSKGISLGAYITITSAITMVILNFIAYSTTGTLAFDKFSLYSNSVWKLVIITGGIFFEVLVFGMISTFVVLQAMKSKTKL